MTKSRKSDLFLFSEAVERLYQPVEIADFAPNLFAVVEKLIPGSMISFDEVNLRTGTLRHARNFELSRPAEWFQQLSINLSRDHPIVHYVRDGGIEPVLHLKDFMSQRQLEKTALYHENFKEPGVVDQIAVMLPISGSVSGMAVNRDIAFRPRELDLIRLLSRHILQAHANARVFSALPLQARTGDHQKLLGTLTPREAEVLHWVAEGKRDREIAIILDSSPRTIQKHVQQILAKLGVETRSGAAATFHGI